MAITIDALFGLLAEYDEVASDPDKLRQVFGDYERWLKKHGIG
jgi:hypothetical protein